MTPKLVILPLCWLLFSLPYWASAQTPQTAKNPPKLSIDSMMLESAGFSLKQISTSTDTAKATVHVRVREKSVEKDPIQGAVVLLRRDKDKTLGRVTERDGKCLFGASPATYTLRVQMTGLKTLEKQGIQLEGGKVYNLEIMMTSN